MTGTGKNTPNADVRPVGQWLYRFGRREFLLSSRTHIMGILNVTPDSFSDGGRYHDPEAAVDRALEMVEEGADFIDIGGESTRPRGKAYGDGAQTVPAEEELRRVIPVITRLASAVDTPISIDTYKAVVAKEALAAGAAIVNDISGFTFDPAMPLVVGERNGSAILMHLKGTPQTMQVNPEYRNLFEEISEFFRKSIAIAHAQGIHQLILDPGIGFGKSQSHNLELINGLNQFVDLGFPVLMGLSRKTFIGNILNLPIDERMEGSLAAAVVAVLRGANIVRVHDVKGTKRGVMIADAIMRSGKPYTLSR